MECFFYLVHDCCMIGYGRTTLALALTMTPTLTLALTMTLTLTRALIMTLTLTLALTMTCFNHGVKIPTLRCMSCHVEHASSHTSWPMHCCFPVCGIHRNGSNTGKNTRTITIPKSLTRTSSSSVPTSNSVEKVRIRGVEVSEDGKKAKLR